MSAKLVLLQVVASILVFNCAAQTPPIVVTGTNHQRIALSPPPEGFSGSVLKEESTANKDEATSRIFHGFQAANGQFPFAVFVETKESRCSGALITPRVVLTAAHCVITDAFNKTGATLFAVSSTVGQVDYTRGEKITADAVYIPKYNRQTKFGDLALLELSEPSSMPVVETPFPFDSMADIPSVTAIGWGMLNSKVTPYTLHFATLPTLSPAECKQKHTYYAGFTMPRGMTCYGRGVRDATACVGDLGGPLLADGLNQGKASAAVGVMSWGPGAPCGVGKKITFATDMIYWTNWVSDIVSLYNLKGKKVPARENRLEKGTQCYTGPENVIETVKSVCAGRCCEFCRGNTNCKAWTWRASTQKCQLRSVVSSLRVDVNCLSGHF